MLVTSVRNSQTLIYVTFLYFGHNLCQGAWNPPVQPKTYKAGDPTYLLTSGNKEYKDAWYTVEDRTQFVFSVKACAEAYIALASYPEITTDFTIEIALGVDSNRRSQIKYVFENDAIFDTYTHNILHCNEYRMFWIRWKKGYIEVGRGAFAGEQTIMNTQDAVDHIINAIGLASSGGQSANWKVNENSGDRLILFTGNVYKYEHMWKSIAGKNFWSFAVMGAGHAHIVLTEELGVTHENVVEFVIGGWDNNRTVIRTGTYWDSAQIVRDEWTYGILSATEYRNFWIGWMNGTMEVGHGTLYGRHRILRWRESTLKPRYLGVSTGFGASGDWLIQDAQDSLNYVFSRKRESVVHRTWIESPRKQFFTFQIQACQHASVLLATNRTTIPGTTVEVILGERNNTKTNFRYLDQAPFAEVDTPDILNCFQTKYFWLSWHENVIRLGNWHIYDYNLILEETLTVPLTIRAISLETPHEKGIWMVSDSIGERMEFYTIDSPDFSDFGELWRTVTLVNYFVFSVKACSDAHVGVAPVPGVERDEIYYDIVISGWENTRTQIRRVLNGERTDASDPVDTPELLHCNSPRQFWVMWDQNRISVGRGALPGHYAIIEATSLDIYPIKAVSVATGFGHAGTWYLDDENSDYMMFYNSRFVNDNVLGLESDMTWISFKLRVCRDAQIILASTKGGASYEIIIAAENNTKSLIKVNGNEVASANTYGFMSCHDDRSVWISWENGFIQVGWSSLVGEYAALVYRDNNPNVAIDRVHIGSSAAVFDGSARWKVFYNAALWASFITSTEYDYHSVWESVDHRPGVVFSVRACSDVHVIMSNLMRHVDRRYEVCIGGWQNSRSVIRMKAVREYVAVQTPGINSCSEERSFWITWINGAIEVGYGEVIGKERFMDFHPSEYYEVRTVGFSTGYGWNGTWSVKLLDELLATSPPATEDTPPVRPGEGDSSLTSGDVAGIIIGVLALIAIVGVLAVIVLKKDTTSPLAFLVQAQSDTAPIVPEIETQKQEEEAEVEIDEKENVQEH